jgi:hypothetical protein
MRRGGFRLRSSKAGRVRTAVVLVFLDSGRNSGRDRESLGRGSQAAVLSCCRVRCCRAVIVAIVTIPEN